MLIFTDGSFSKKPNVAGGGYVIIDKNHTITGGKYNYKCKDNNIAEIFAIYSAILFLEKHNFNDKTIQIISDSQCAIRRINNDDYLSNDDNEIKFLNYIKNYIKNSKHKISFMQIKGHVHDNTKFSYYNNLADQIAREQRLIGIENIKRYINKKRLFRE